MGLQRVGHDWATELNWIETPEFGSKQILSEVWKEEGRLSLESVFHEEITGSSRIMGPFLAHRILPMEFWKTVHLTPSKFSEVFHEFPGKKCMGSLGNLIIPLNH